MAKKIKKSFKQYFDEDEGFRKIREQRTPRSRFNQDLRNAALRNWSDPEYDDELEDEYDDHQYRK